MKRVKSIEALLFRTCIELQNIEQAYNAIVASEDKLVEVSDSLKIDIHDFLAHNKSVLDYLAQEIAIFCSPPPNRPQFPIASRGKTLLDFQNNLNTWFPGLLLRSPELFKYLTDIQYFRDTPWLLEFQEIINFNKHNDLSSQIHSDFVSLIVHFRGVGPRIGELGFRSIVIEQGAILQLRARNGEVRVIRGPQIIDINTTHLADADPDIVIEKIQWSDFKIDPTEHSVVGLLKIINSNVQRIYYKVSDLIAKFQ
jgi:hypothetical protein